MSVKTGKIRAQLKPLVFLLPMTIVYSIFVIYPMLRGFYISLFDWSLIRKIGFVGAANYVEALGDANFWKAFFNTVKFSAISVPVIVTLALLLAMMANQKFRMQRLLRASFYMPSVLSVTVISMIFLFLFAPYNGFVNSLLHSIGVLKDGQEIFWTVDIVPAWTVIILATSWWTVGFYMMLYISAMQDISPELYEAAEIDGATPFKSHIYITLPLLKPTTRVIFLLELIAAFKIFSQVYLITKGGPGTDTRPLMQYIYEMGFVYKRLGYASAISYILLAILLILSIIQNYKTKER